MIADGKKDVIASLIQATPPMQRKTLLTIADEDGNTALHNACRACEFSVVTLLLPLEAANITNDAMVSS